MEKNIAENKVDNNVRSKNTDARISQTTAAWANQHQMSPDANVSIPSDEAVLHAKEWVDNGSKL